MDTEALKRNREHQRQAVEGAVKRLKSDAWPIMWGRCPKCGSWTITDGKLEWCSFIGGEVTPACAWQDALPLNSQAICVVLKETLSDRRARSALAGDGETVRAHIDGLKEAAARVEEDAENKTGPAKIALEDAWSGIQSLIADWEALSALPSPEAPHD